MAVFNEPNQWEHPLGNNADTSTLPDDAAATAGIASLQKLFQIINATPLEAGGIAPDREDINALFKYLGDQIFYILNGGIPSYNAVYDYIPGRVVLYDNKLYKCIQANGASSTVVAPTDSTYWDQIPTRAQIPPGIVLTFGGSTVPEGFLLCNGSAISRSTYAQLFEAIGTIYGAGDGSTTFNLPDLRDRFIEGAGSNALGTYLEAGLPNITGSGVLRVKTSPSDTGDTLGFDYASGAFLPLFSDYQRIPTMSDNGRYSGPAGLAIDVSRSSSIYSKSSTVQPQSLILNAIIKY